MPELPEVETVVRGLRPEVTSAAIAAVPWASELMAESVVGPFAASLTGRRIDALVRQGKWMFYRLDNGWIFVLHLGMTGRVQIAEPAAELLPHTHLRLLLERPGRPTVEFRFTDPRRFGEVLLVDESAWQARFGPAQLGPDALTISRGDFASRLAATRRNLKAALLDQRLVAGIGNIYADESLFAARLAPTRPANTLTPREASRLHRAVNAVLVDAVAANGTSIRDYITVTGVPGEFQERLRVYGRADQPCTKCRKPIRLDRGVVTGRATCWCPQCQK